MRFDLFTALACVLSLLLPCTLALNTPAPNLAVAEIRAVPEDLALSPRDSDVMLEPERFDLETSTASDWSGLSRLDARATCRSGYGGVAAELESVAELVNGAMAVDVAGTINMDVMIRDAAPRTQIAAREVDAAQKVTIVPKVPMARSGAARTESDVSVAQYNPSSGKTMNADPTQLIQASAALGALALAFYVLPYLLDPYDYRRRFPGPPLARFTNWWMSRLTRTGHHSEIVQRLHEKYGTFVRLGPNHISIADPDALETIYGHGSGLLKSEFYHVFQNAPTTDVFNTTDRAEHSKKRKRLANIFSPQNVLAFEPRVRSHIRELCAQLDLQCKEAARGAAGANWRVWNRQAAVNICAQISYLAFDIIGDLALGSPFGLIQAQKDSSPSIESVDASGEPQRGTVEIPVVKTIAGGGATLMAVGFFPPWTHKLLQFLPWNLTGLFDNLNFIKLATMSVDARLKRGPRKNPENGKQSIDLIDKLLEVKNEDGSPLPVNELYAETVALLIAGSDTTSNTLSSLFYHMAIDTELQQRLQAELDEHIPYDSSDESNKKEGLIIPPYDAIAQYEDIKNLPYLNACLKEALRIHSTVGTGLLRVVPPGKTITIRGQTFKPGSVISVPSYTTNRMNVWGDVAEAFRPERWLDDHAGSFNKYFVPFSVGPRACIGRNLAYMDLMLIAATIFRRYHLEALPTTKMVVHETFVREAAHCEIAIKRRNAPE